MSDERWRVTIWSHPSYERLVAELYFEGKILAILDREDGPDAVKISFAPSDKFEMSPNRVDLEDVLKQLEAAASDLRQ